jgi:uncharacterized repeat protein (TIGR04076 family)
MRSGRPNIKITIESVANGCSIDLKEGESWLITNRTPSGMCLSAYATLYPEDMSTIRLYLSASK